MHDVREGELAVPAKTLPSIEEEGNVERLASFGGLLWMKTTRRILTFVKMITFWNSKLRVLIVGLLFSF